MPVASERDMWTWLDTGLFSCLCHHTRSVIRIVGYHSRCDQKGLGSSRLVFVCTRAILLFFSYFLSSSYNASLSCTRLVYATLC
jgi:hypothetical protein